MSKIGQIVYEQQALWDECYAAGIGWGAFVARYYQELGVAPQTVLPLTLNHGWRVLEKMKKERAVNEGQ